MRSSAASRFRPDRAMMRDGEHEGSVGLGLGHSYTPFFCLFWSDRAQDATLVVLRQGAAQIVVDGKLREAVYLGQACRVKSPIQTAVSTAAINNARSYGTGCLRVHLRSERYGKQRRPVITPHDGRHTATRLGDAYEFAQHPVGIPFFHDRN